VPRDAVRGSGGVRRPRDGAARQRDAGPTGIADRRTARTATGHPPARPDGDPRLEVAGLEGRAAGVVGVVVAAGAAALSGLAVIASVVLVAWAADSRSGAPTADALRAAADAWLLAHRGMLSVPDGTIGLTPLGLTVLPAVLLHRAGASLARVLGVADLRAAGWATGGMAVAYGIVAALVARLAATPAASVGAISAGIGAGLLAVLAGWVGVIRGGDLGSAVRAALPDAAPVVAKAAAVAVATMVAAGAGLLAAALALHAGRANELTRALDPGLVGGVALLLVGILLVPNAIVWAAAYAVGPGFAVGAGTSVSPFGVALGPVPALPLLAALPQGDSAPPAARLVLVGPLLAGVLAGVLVARGLPAGAGRRAACGAAAGLVAALGLAGLAALSAGSVGGGYLTSVGPTAWEVGIVAAAEIGVPAALTAAVLPGRAADTADTTDAADMAGFADADPAEPATT
jgi:Family of unknown function (DUF6350)